MYDVFVWTIWMNVHASHADLSTYLTVQTIFIASMTEVCLSLPEYWLNNLRLKFFWTIEIFIFAIMVGMEFSCGVTCYDFALTHSASPHPIITQGMYLSHASYSFWHNLEAELHRKPVAELWEPDTEHDDDLVILGERIHTVFELPETHPFPTLLVSGRRDKSIKRVDACKSTNRSTTYYKFESKIMWSLHQKPSDHQTLVDFESSWRLHKKTVSFSTDRRRRRTFASWAARIQRMFFVRISELHTQQTFMECSWSTYSTREFPDPL